MTCESEKAVLLRNSQQNMFLQVNLSSWKREQGHLRGTFAFIDELLPCDWTLSGFVWQRSVHLKC